MHALTYLTRCGVLVGQIVNSSFRDWTGCVRSGRDMRSYNCKRELLSRSALNSRSHILTAVGTHPYE